MAHFIKKMMAKVTPFVHYVCNPADHQELPFVLILVGVFDLVHRCLPDLGAPTRNCDKVFIAPHFYTIYPRYDVPLLYDMFHIFVFNASHFLQRISIFTFRNNTYFSSPSQSDFECDLPL